MIATASRRRYAWGRWLLVPLAAALLVFVLGQFMSARALDLDLSRADWRWAAVALAMQVLFFLLYGGLYRYAFRAVGVTSEALHLVPVLLASIFVKTVLPLTAAPAAAVFIDDAAARGQSGARTAVGLVVVLIVDLVMALPFVAAGALALVLSARLVAFALAGTALFVAFIAVLLILLALAGLRPAVLEALLGACRAVVNHGARLIGRPSLLADDWAQHTADQLVAAVTSVPRHPRDIAVASGHSLLLHVANLVALGALFVTFGQRLDSAALLAGFGMSIVFFVVTIVPDGIGAVEGAMALVFVQLGMTPTAAILVTLAYRVLNVWLPVAIGFWCARRLRLFGADTSGWVRQRVIEPEPLDATVEPAEP
ncbi:MAG: lysylphosphatidylglycerol synthase transmembrane domain-containing protein [Candidatus Limnocylindrales bacterium]